MKTRHNTGPMATTRATGADPVADLVRPASPKFIASVLRRANRLAAKLDRVMPKHSRFEGRIADSVSQTGDIDLYVDRGEEYLPSYAAKLAIAEGFTLVFKTPALRRRNER
jgi:hypothetical protein